ncbi:MAG: M20/M25/M40 family metallo-hydrolase, partial [Haloferacaceae archaeon]
QNVVSETTEMRVEVRGATTEIRDWMYERARRVVDGAATMHGVDVDVTLCGRADSFVADDDPVDAVRRAARECPEVEMVERRDQMGASDDAANLLRQVQDYGGEGTYVCIGASNPSGHHTPRFDIDEDSLDIGVDVLTEAIRNVSRNSVEQS